METKHYDLVVYNGSPAGIACAVRSAREGLSVLIVNHTPILGGMISNGLCVWDTQYEGKRSPIYDELRQAIFDYYRSTYGEDSPQYKTALPGPPGHSNGNFEPKVAQLMVEKMVSAESGIELLMRYFPVGAETEARVIRNVTFAEMGRDGLPKENGNRTTVGADAWADCSYEGDLMAVCGAPYRYGREPRSEFDEPHAGKIFVRRVIEPPTKRMAFLGSEHEKLNLRPFPGHMEILPADGEGDGDEKVQAFNWRSMLTNVAGNKLPVEKPAGYDRDYIETLEKPSVNEYGAPNIKHRINRPQLVGSQNPYVEGTWIDRKRVMDEHWNALLGSLYFICHDESVPEERREEHRQWGLPKDEFADNNNRPYEMYVRESRRLEGRYVFTEHDATYVDEITRAPVHADTIAVTEWYIDIHACSFETVPGSIHEGKVMLHQETFPGQVPFGAILPAKLDNLLVPLCVSTSHVGWSTIRLEPTWMNIGEAAGWAVALAKDAGVSPADIDPDTLVRLLADRRVMISFFNDVDLGANEPWIPGVSYFATKGFFPGYDAKAAEPLDGGTAGAWADAFTQLRDGESVDPMETARTVAVSGGGSPMTFAAFSELARVSTKGEGLISRGEACRAMYAALEKR